MLSINDYENTKMNVDDVVYLFDLQDVPVKALKPLDLEGERIDDGSSTLKLSLSLNENIITEQMIIFRRNRYIISEFEINKSERRINIICDALWVELNDTPIEDFTVSNGDSINNIGNAILKDTGWTMGEVPVDNNKYFLSEQGKTALYLLRRLAMITGTFIRFDTLNRKVNLYVKEEESPSFFLHYKKNIKGITKTVTAPRATVIYPYGKNDLTIGSVNSGKNYIEDYSWYESLGISLEDAKKRFKKTQIIKDARFIFPGNLMRWAKEKLKLLSQPQISYEIDSLNLEADVGDVGYVVDEEIDVKVKVKVVRIIEYLDKSKNKYELNYLIPGIQDSEMFDENVSAAENEEKIITAKTDKAFTASESYQRLLGINYTAFNNTTGQVGITIVGQASTTMDLDGYFEIEGNKVGMPLKQTIIAGWNTVSMTFMLDKIAMGTSSLDFQLNCSTGSFSIDAGNATMFLRAESLLGAPEGPKVPEADIIENVKIPSPETLLVATDGKPTIKLEVI
ncbi:phage tail spike protein [Caldifermentibacillus hisashii]|uniref:phage tail spike protein n=1 Tax=Caldifermentibacillus hisashii TaxID=996558 RepID=UPI0031B6F3BA